MAPGGWHQRSIEVTLVLRFFLAGCPATSDPATPALEGAEQSAEGVLVAKLVADPNLLAEVTGPIGRSMPPSLHCTTTVYGPRPRRLLTAIVEEGRRAMSSSRGRERSFFRICFIRTVHASYKKNAAPKRIAANFAEESPRTVERDDSCLLPPAPGTLRGGVLQPIDPAQ